MPNQYQERKVIDPWRYLALAVIKQALDDICATEPRWRPTKSHRAIYLEWKLRVHDAIQFLTRDSEEFRVWCELADLDIEALKEPIARAIYIWRSGNFVPSTALMEEARLLEEGKE